MLSMTGYGRATCETDGRQLTIELKSVNHRFLDLSFRMPRNLMFLEDDARKAIAEKLARGHVDVFMTYRNLRSDARTVQVDRALFDAYAQALDTLAGGGLRDDRSLMSVARMPDVMIVTEAEEDQDAVRALMLETMAQALEQLLAMRRREGASMAEDLGRKKVSDEMNISPRYLANIENKGQQPSLQIFYELVTRYDISVDQFFFPDKTAEKSTQRRQLDTLLDSMSDKGIRIVTATAKEIAEVENEN